MDLALKNSPHKPTAGFTLLELLIAITASVLIASAALGVFKEAADSEKRLNADSLSLFKRIQLCDLIDQLLANQSGPVHGNRDRFAFLSESNLLGFGKEVVCIYGIEQNGMKTAIIRLAPVLYSDQQKEEDLVQQFYDNPDSPLRLSHTEAFAGFTPEFTYGYSSDDPTQKTAQKTDKEKQRLSSITAIIHEDNDHEWYATRNWQ